MPRVSEFFGIAIYMYYREHEPPHFHAIYSGDDVLVTIADLSSLRGQLPPRAMGMVIEWAARHRDELMADWRRAAAHEPLVPIEPLR